MDRSFQSILQTSLLDQQVHGLDSPIQRISSAKLDKAVQEIGLFGNQNTVCKPTTPKWRSTVERLKEKFPDFDK